MYNGVPPGDNISGTLLLRLADSTLARSSSLIDVRLLEPEGRREDTGREKYSPEPFASGAGDAYGEYFSLRT